MSIFIEVKEPRQQYTNEIEFRNEFFKNSKLCKYYIFSVNCVKKLFYAELSYNLLYNYLSIEIFEKNKGNALLSIEYNLKVIDDTYKFDQETMDMFKTIMTDYEDKNDIIEKL